AATPLIQTRMQLLGEAAPMLRFLFVPDADLEIEDDAMAAVAGAAAAQSSSVLEAATPVLTALPEWTAGGIEGALRGGVVEGLGLKPKVAFTPLRVAVTGRRVSPPLFESMEILGRDACLARVAALHSRLAAVTSSG